jgi:ubiquinone/menaquinone biosynthesis C-methylase UbiE
MTNSLPSPNISDEENVRSTFDRFWTDQTALGEIDDTGSDILRLFEQEIPRIPGASFLEVGSGSGRISLALARRGARVTLLDNSQAAIDLSKGIFARNGQEATFVLASAFEMPLPDSSFDVVWNSGVIEHFLLEDQVRMLREMLRVLKPGGTLITFNPSHEGRIYRLAKYLLERTGKWPYGREIPIKTLQPHADRLHALLTKEFNAGFDLQFTYFLSRGIPVKDFFRSRPTLNAWMTKHFGGYMKVSVMKKAATNA